MNYQQILFADTYKKDHKREKEKEKEKEKDFISSSTFVIQKYIESPLLINNRKFDIRMWVLITHEMDCYLFKEGYLRTSGNEFVISKYDIDNKYIHLTNNAVQKYSNTYGAYEDGNQMSFNKFQAYLNTLENPFTNIKIDMKADILPQIKNIVRKTMVATRRKLNPDNRKWCFEIFGYDFMIDSDFNVWLIEVNTNPCLETSSNLLKVLLPRMIDDAFKLTLDVLFPPFYQYTNIKLKSYSVDGYENNENMW